MKTFDDALDSPIHGRSGRDFRPATQALLFREELETLFNRVNSLRRLESKLGVEA